MWNRESSVKAEPRVDQAATSPALPSEERRVVAWVGKSVVFKGTLTSSEDMTIDGRMEGSIEVRDHGLTIGPDADIRANIVATTVTIHGSVAGNIQASGKVDIRATGRIEGDVTAPRVVVADGAVLRGKVDTLRAEAKSRPQLAAV
jgi:cytoskeletal protein CcmA (bactofilin family)